MQSGPNRNIIVDTRTTVTAAASATHKGCIITIPARRPQPPPAVPLDLRTRGRVCSAFFCIYSIFCFSCFTVRSKLAIKSITSITCFCNGQKIYFICCVHATLATRIWIVIIHNCCVLYVRLFCRCKCRI